jgi:hypothetical protein
LLPRKQLQIGEYLVAIIGALKRQGRDRLVSTKLRRTRRLPFEGTLLRAVNICEVAAAGVDVDRGHQLAGDMDVGRHAADEAAAHVQHRRAIVGACKKSQFFLPKEMPLSVFSARLLSITRRPFLGHSVSTDRPSRTGTIPALVGCGYISCCNVARQLKRPLLKSRPVRSARSFKPCARVAYRVGIEHEQ